MPADAFGGFGAHFDAWHVGLGGLLEVELAALPWPGGKGSLTGGGHALMMMIVDDDVTDSAQAAR